MIQLFENRHKLAYAVTYTVLAFITATAIFGLIGSIYGPETALTGLETVLTALLWVLAIPGGYLYFRMLDNWFTKIHGEFIGELAGARVSLFLIVSGGTIGAFLLEGDSPFLTCLMLVTAWPLVLNLAFAGIAYGIRALNRFIDRNFSDV